MNQVALNTSSNSVKLCSSNDLSVIDTREDISAHVNKMQWRHFE